MGGNHHRVSEQRPAAVSSDDATVMITDIHSCAKQQRVPWPRAADCAFAPPTGATVGSLLLIVDDSDGTHRLLRWKTNFPSRTARSWLAAGKICMLLHRRPESITVDCGNSVDPDETRCDILEKVPDGWSTLVVVLG